MESIDPTQEKNATSNNQHTIHSKPHSFIPLIFTFAFVGFFFTFCDFRCGGQTIGSVTGFDFVTGTELQSPNYIEEQAPPPPEVIPPNAWAIIAFIASIFGMSLFLIKINKVAPLTVTLGLLGSISLIILQIGIKAVVKDKGQGQIVAVFQFGYWISMLSFIGSVILIYFKKHASNVTILPNVESQIKSDEPPKKIQIEIPKFSINIKAIPLKTRKYFIGSISILILSIVIYKQLFKSDPQGDGQKMADAYCDCAEEKWNDLITSLNQFDLQFDSYNFKTRSDARLFLSIKHDSLNKIWEACLKPAIQKYEEHKTKYISNADELKQYEYAYQTYKKRCEDAGSKMPLINESDSRVKERIRSIQIPTPGLDEIKHDLVGKILSYHMYGWSWKIRKESQISDLQIVDNAESSDYIHYGITFNYNDDSGNQLHVTTNIGYKLKVESEKWKCISEQYLNAYIELVQYVD